MAHQTPGGSSRRNDDSRTRETDSRQAQQAKRPRLEQAGADDGDWDDIQLTQQDLDTLDVIASQAAHEPARQDSGTRHADPEQTLPLSRDMSTTVHEQQSLFQVPGPSGAYQLKGKSSSSSNSESSVYPASSTSFGKTSSDASTAPGSLTTPQSSSSHSSDRSLGDTSIAVSILPTAAGMRDELIRRTEETRRLQAELEKTRKEVYARDGEVKFLRDSLHRQEAELEKLRADQEERQEKEEEQQKQREQELKTQNERLQTQIQFLQQEAKQLQDRYQAMEQRIHQLQALPSIPGPTAAAGVPSTSTPNSPSKSPRQKKVVTGRGASKTPEKGAFPSRHSFMAGPGDAASALRAIMQNTTDSGTMTIDSSTIPLPQLGGHQRHLTLNVSSSRGAATGPQVVSQLLQCSCSASGEVDDNGIVSLVQMLPTRLDLSGLRYERDSLTLRLASVMRFRSGEMRRQSSGASPPVPPPAPPKPIVGKENFLLAVQGLRNLLESTPQESPPGTDSAGSPHYGSQHDVLGNAVFLLPLLNDYLFHYIDTITTSTANVGLTSPVLISSESGGSESSLESLTSSLGLLLQAGTEYANSVETLTLCALRVLHKLVCMCANVRSVCLGSRLSISFLQQSTDTSSSTIETDQEKEPRVENSSAVIQASESGMEGDDEHSTSSSSFSSTLFSPEHYGSPTTRLQGPNILHNVVCLASPSQEGSGYNAHIVQEALRVLIALAEKSSDADVDRLNIVIKRGVLTECLSLDQQYAITLLALKLFTQLARARSIILFLCSKSDRCTLHHVHLIVIKHLRAVKSMDSKQVLQIIDQVIASLTAVITYHRNGITRLMDNNCPCSAQILPSVVHALLYLLQEYLLSSDPDILATLRRGVLLLHSFCIWDTNYQFRCNAISLYYTALMSGLSRVYKIIPDIPKDEVLAMEELWDEDDSDSDHEDGMDTQ